MKNVRWLFLFACGCSLLAAQNHDPEPGRFGGRLRVAQRTEPKTFNPVTALDGPSREIVRRLMGDLVTIDRASHETVPNLAESWKADGTGAKYELRLREGLQFSDGHALDADDVVFSFQVYLDEKVGSPQRGLLLVNGKAPRVTKVNSRTVRVELGGPYAAAERMFDSVAILPRHILEKEYQAGRFREAWGVGTAPEKVVGAGPFRLKSYKPGQEIVIERNPYYWKKGPGGRRLPYLDEVAFEVLGNEDTEVLRFRAGELDISGRLSAQNFAALERDSRAQEFAMGDLGPSVDYNFLFFNLNDLDCGKAGAVCGKQAWFRDRRFRQAVNAAIDREGMTRLIYQGRATALGSHVTPANKRWLNTKIPAPRRDVEKARRILKEAGYGWKGTQLVDGNGRAVEFTIVASTSSKERMQMAAILQQDLKQLGMDVQAVPLEFRSLVNRVTQTFDYEACVLGVGAFDPDPNGEMNVWPTNGSTHLWHLGQKTPATQWEAEIDRLMQEQMTALDGGVRKKLYDRVQEIVAEQLPLLPLVSPNVLVAGRREVGNFRPVVLESHTLWNAEWLFLRRPEGGR